MIVRTCSVRYRHGMAAARPLTLQSSDIQHTANTTQVGVPGARAHKAVRDTSRDHQLVLSRAIELQVLYKRWTSKFKHSTTVTARRAEGGMASPEDS